MTGSSIPGPAPRQRSARARAAPPNLTLFLGPMSAHGLALNDIVRVSRHRLARAGVTAWPNRAALRALRAARERGRWSEETAPLFVSAVGGFGPPSKVLGKGELLPNLERNLVDFERLFQGRGDVRLLLAPDALHRLFLERGNDALFARVRATRWEALYELSWRDVVAECREALPEAEIAVLTPKSAAVGAEASLEMLFGPAAGGVARPGLLTRAALAPTGQAVLDRMEAASALTEERAEELLAAFPAMPDPLDLRRNLGMDRVTAELLDQRFAEDIASIEEMPGVVVP